eukprot:1868859-Rhodomonas_salina.2
MVLRLCYAYRDRLCYAIQGTDIGCAIGCATMCGTEIGYAAIRCAGPLSTHDPSLSGTPLRYHRTLSPMLRPVLVQRMLLGAAIPYTTNIAYALLSYGSFYAIPILLLLS